MRLPWRWQAAPIVIRNGDKVDFASTMELDGRNHTYELCWSRVGLWTWLKMLFRGDL